MTGEFELIERLRALLAREDAAVEIGIGDDAAALHLGGGRRLLWTTDTLVERVHFDPARETPEDLGWRAVASNVSDIAAMGGRPRWALLSLVLPAARAGDWAEALGRGVAQAADAAGMIVVGGNLARGTETSITLAVLGECSAPPLRRTGARAGDLLFLTGPVGAGAAGRTTSEGDPEGRSLRARYLRPTLRLDAAAVLLQVASAAIDLSDGLVQDLGHLADASGVAVRLFLDALPLAFGHPRDAAGPGRELALHGGEDYEIVAALPPNGLGLASRLLAEAGVGMYRVGEVAAAPVGAVVGVAADGSETPLERAGWRHFA